MTPIARVAWGYAAVVLDLRIAGVDVVPDLLGWLVVLWGAWSLAGESRWFSLAGAASAGGLVVAVPTLGAEPGPVLATLEIVVEAGLVLGVCSGLRALVAEEKVRRSAAGLRALALALATCVLLGGAAVGFTRVESLWAIPLGIGGLVVVVWFLLLLFGLKDHPSLRGTAVGAAPRTP